MIDDESGMLSVSGLFRDYSHLYETVIKAAVSLNELYPDEKKPGHQQLHGGQQDEPLKSMIASSRTDTMEESGNLSEKFRMGQELPYKLAQC